MSLATDRFLILASLSLFGCAKPDFGPPDVEKGPKRYPSLRLQWLKRGRGLVDHFPKVIPATATRTQLSAFPGFLQGGGWLQLRLTLPSAEVVRIYEEASSQAKAFYDGGDFFKLVNDQKDGLPGTAFHTSDSQDRDFPTDYRVFIYDARPSQTGGDFQWNHGNSRGVVISGTRNEVIYFAEDW